MADDPFLPTYPPSQLRSHSPIPYDTGVISSTTNDTNSRRRSLPFVFPPLFPKNTTSTFLIPSTAEGRPIPLDGSTAAHRTTALRQLSRSQPSSRRRYSGTSRPSSIKSTTTGTYSQPVVVRTYSGTLPSSSTKGPASVSATLPPPPSSGLSSKRLSRNGTMKNTMRHKGSGKARAAADAKLPPLESFTFKSIMADMQQDVGADLDRIAEICARTRYSLSNQYEVHIAPHGSPGFLGPPSTSLAKHHTSTGPTLQAISSDDEHTTPLQRRRRNVARRRSAAYGTLETIMSSSRSSDEDKSKKKPAAQIVAEVGRSAIDAKDESSSGNSTEAQASSEQQDDQQGYQLRPSLFATAIIDSSRYQAQRSTPRVPGTTLLSGPAEPQTSRNHLQTKTSPGGSSVKYHAREILPQPSRAVAWGSVAAATITPPEERSNPSSLLSGLRAWVSWRGTASELAALDIEGPRGHSSYAEGTLKELLRSTEQLGDAKNIDSTI
ncbi:hypothetical protein GGS26DRAFT_537652 [Hypomontagnella submonticulosa]|nr:hypothetical protein GGS26DRAFT_537652 [Hypomontagnella submonticulosa]